MSKDNCLHMKTQKNSGLFSDKPKDDKRTNLYKVITLCGSTKSKEEFLEVQKRLTLKGYIVISVGLFGHSGDTEVGNYKVKQMLDDMHKRKIDMAEEIFVIDVDGYIGESTLSEIVYAENYGKKVHYYSKNQQRLYQEGELI